MPEEQVPTLIARELGVPPPPHTNEGYAFDLDGGLVLRLAPLPGGGWIAQVPVLESGSGPQDGEERAARLMRLHLARMSGAPGVVASVDASGEFIVHTRLPAAPDDAIVAAVETLLNEAEAIRKGLGKNASASAPGGFPGGFPGMGGIDLSGIGRMKWL